MNKEEETPRYPLIREYTVFITFRGRPQTGLREDIFQRLYRIPRALSEMLVIMDGGIKVTSYDVSMRTLTPGDEGYESPKFRKPPFPPRSGH